MEIKSFLFTKENYSQTHMNLLYNFYKETWESTFKELGSAKGSLAEDFCRFDIKVGFFKDLMPLAFHGYQYFDLNLFSDREHPYFKQISVPLVNQLLAKGVSKIATLEYMCVKPKYRRESNNGLGELLGGFSTQYFKDSSVDGVITITRNNRGVNRMCKMYGAEALYEDLKLHNVHVDVMLFKPESIQENPRREVQSEIELLLGQVSNQNKHRGVA